MLDLSSIVSINSISLLLESLTISLKLIVSFNSLLYSNIFSKGTFKVLAISWSLGTLPSFSVIFLMVCKYFCIFSTTATGILIFLDWFLIALWIDWLIHQVAYVANLNPILGSNLSTAFIKPIFPSPIRSINSNPLSIFFLATFTTSFRLDSMILSLISLSLVSI